MAYLLLFVAGVLGGLVLARFLRRKTVQQPSAAHVSTPVVTPPVAIPPPVAPAPKPELSRGEAIAALQSQVEAAGAASSHPRDMQHNAAFRQAVELLAAADTPLDLTLGYALGANWEMACAALAALPARAE